MIAWYSTLAVMRQHFLIEEAFLGGVLSGDLGSGVERPGSGRKGFWGAEDFAEEDGLAESALGMQCPYEGGRDFRFGRSDFRRLGIFEPGQRSLTPGRRRRQWRWGRFREKIFL